MVGWHHQLDGHEFEQVLGVGDGQGSLACCSPWGHKESDMTEAIEHAHTRQGEVVMGVWYSCLENPHGQRSLAGYSP